MVTFLKETGSFQTRRSKIKTALTFAGRGSDSCFSAVHFFFPRHCWLSLTIIVARKKSLLFFTLNPAFEWQVGYNGMRPNLSIPHGRKCYNTIFNPTSPESCSVWHCQACFCWGGHWRWYLPRDNQKIKIGQTFVSFNYKIKIRHTTLISKVSLFSKSLSLCVLNGKNSHSTKNKIKLR